MWFRALRAQSPAVTNNDLSQRISSGLVAAEALSCRSGRGLGEGPGCFREMVVPRETTVPDSDAGGPARSCWSLRCKRVGISRGPHPDPLTKGTFLLPHLEN